MITVLETSALNTVQDLGRTGYRQFGVGTSGAMDPLAVEIGNVLLGNPPGAACIEIQTYPFVIRFESAGGFAVTGVDAALDLDGRPVLAWTAEQAAAGQVLTVGPPRGGARAYLCVSGGLDVPVVLGSRSTQLRGGFGGLSGRPLEAGDVLNVTGGPATSGYGALPPSVALCRPCDIDDGGIVTLRAIPATDFHLFTDASRERFWDTAWRITPQSDRVGYRLNGDPLRLQRPVELRSYGIVPGIIQVPPAGEPIVQMADANTAGGYPRIAAVIEADLWRLAQARIGTRIRFARCDHEQGVAAMQPIASYLGDLRRMVALYGASARRRAPRTSGA